MNLSPIQLLREAIKAVPALKYALGVVGLVAVVAIVGVFRIRPDIAAAGCVVTLVLMVALLVFAKLTKTAQRHFLLPALVLMWSFLVLVIAAAGFLFTSTFFKWPVDFQRSPGPNTNTNATVEVEGILKVAGGQLDLRDFSGAWTTLQRAAAKQPDSPAVIEAQADVAMKWVRTLDSMGPRTVEVYEQLTSALFAALPKAKGTREADLLAHIGWAYFLEWKRTGAASLVNVDEQFEKALKIDRQNTFANAMMAYRLSQSPGHVKEARRHFDIAMMSKRDPNWVMWMQIGVLRAIDTDENKLELARVANEMRKNGEALSADSREDLFMRLYWLGAGFSYLTNLIHALPAAEHLATLNWLAGEEGWGKSWPQQKFVLARLREQTGDWPGALELYQNLGNIGAEYANEVKQGIARCKARAKTQ